jgi:diacylglycerol O-acyltransferase
MKQLPGLDASFLHLETPQMPMHVGALHNFELPADYTGDFVEDMRLHMAARLVHAPALRQKLARMPLNFANPSWIDAEPDLTEHIVRITLPKGSGQAELEAKVGELHPVLLERDRPLWKFHVFDGLAPGPNGERRYAMYTQLHHAAVDGQAAVALGQAILDLTPVPPRAGAKSSEEATKAGNARRPLGMADMLRAALANQLDLVVDAVKAIPSKVGTLSQMAASAMPKKGVKRVGNLGLAPRTRLNVTVSAQRAFASISLPLAQLNSTRRKHHASLNDAVLMICSGALRRYFLHHGPLPRKSLVAGVPVSTRTKGDTSSNNQATMTVVSLGTHIGDPKKRLAHVLAATAAMKNNMGHMKSLMPSDFPSLGVPWLMEGLGALYAKAKVADRLPAIANVTISNVPGPTVPLYMAGAKMLTNYPTSIVVHGVALNITVQTYNESLEFGLISCGEAMPDVAELALYVQEAFDEFQALPPTAAPAPAEAPNAVAGAARKTPRKTASKPIRKPTSKPAPQAKRTKKPAVAEATKARANAPTKAR